MIISPAVLDAGTYTLQVSEDPEATAASAWTNLQGGDPFADLVVIAAKARVFYELPVAPAFRIFSSVNVTADRVFEVAKSLMISS